MLQPEASTKMSRAQRCYSEQQADYPGTHWRHTTTVHEATATAVTAAIDVVAVPMNATAINAAIVTVDSTNTLSIARCSTAVRPAAAADLHTA